MSLQYGQVIEGIGSAELAGVDEAHEDAQRSLPLAAPVVHAKMAAISLGRISEEPAVDPQADNDIAGAIAAIQRGERVTFERMAELFYDEYRRTAHDMMEWEPASLALDPLAAVNQVLDPFMTQDLRRLPCCEAYKRLNIAAVRTTRRVLVEDARRKKAAIQARDKDRVPLDDNPVSLEPFEVFLIDIDEVLSELDRVHKQQSLVLELWFFGDLSAREIELHLDLAGGVVESDIRTTKALVRARHLGERSS